MKRIKLIVLVLLATTLFTTTIFATGPGDAIKTQPTSDNKADTEVKIGLYTDNGDGTWTENKTGTVISAEVPLKLVCAINPNAKNYGKAFVSPEFEVTNTSNAPIDISIAISESDTCEMKIVDKDTNTDPDWEKIGVEKSKTEIALNMKEVDGPVSKWFTNTDKTLRLGTFLPKTDNSKKYKFEAKHGMAFSGPISANYKLTFTISLSK